MPEIPRPRPTRADALRNREKVLRATADLLVEEGSAVGLEAIAKRAGVGIATLYRHFPDRTVLLRHVAMDVVQRTAAAAKTALAEGPDAFSALASYIHAAIELRVGVILPMIADRIPGDKELFEARDESRRALEALVQAAHDEKSLRQDIGPGDINLLVIRVARPLPLPIDPEVNRRLSHRHAEIILDGLVQFNAAELGDRPPLEVAELKTLPADGSEPVWVDRRDYWHGDEDVRESFADNGDRSTTNDS
jgi:AcrR family transcriptional regulator